MPSGRERLDEAEEQTLIGEATARLAKEEGRAPEGWLGPWISHSHVTPDLLAEAGYRYLLDWCMDDQPVWFGCRGGRRIMAVPYPQEINDIPAIVARRENASDFADMIVDQFDEMRELSQTGRSSWAWRCMPISWASRIACGISSAR